MHYLPLILCYVKRPITAKTDKRTLSRNNNIHMIKVKKFYKCFWVNIHMGIHCRYYTYKCGYKLFCLSFWYDCFSRLRCIRTIKSATKAKNHILLIDWPITLPPITTRMANPEECYLTPLDKETSQKQQWLLRHAYLVDKL